jgi:hypothetical protein
MLPVIEAGELRPVCTPCGLQAGQLIKIHPRSVDVLTEYDQLAEARKIVAALNSQMTRIDAFSNAESSGESYQVKPS